jgi:hypothetical protein
MISRLWRGRRATGSMGLSSWARHTPSAPQSSPMMMLLSTLWGVMTLGGVVSFIGVVGGYFCRKYFEYKLDIKKAQTLRPKEYIKLYGPDERVVKLVEVDGRLNK